MTQVEDYNLLSLDPAVIAQLESNTCDFQLHTKIKAKQKELKFKDETRGKGEIYE